MSLQDTLNRRSIQLAILIIAIALLIIGFPRNSGTIEKNQQDQAANLVTEPANLSQLNISN